MPYTPANQAGADSAYYGTLSNLTSNNQRTYDTASTGYNSVLGNIQNNPYNADAISGTVGAAKDAMAAGNNDIAAAGTLRSYADPLIQYGFDPQGANYNFGLTQAQDMQKVNNAQAGVAGSPFGAGLVGDAGQSFQRSWDAGKAQRAAQAIQALQQLFSGASGLENRGAQAKASAAILPQQEYFDIQNETLAALNSLVEGLGSASQPLQSDISGFGKYLQLGQNATQIADQATAQNNAQPGILGGLASVFGLSTGGGGTLGGDLIGAIPGL